MSNQPTYDRRAFLRNTGLTLAAAQLGAADVAKAQTGTSTSFASIRQVDAGLLNIGYAEAGPAGGPAVVLLHGWPYDIHSYVEVAPLLAAHGYRVIVPYLRGYGTTRFLSSETFATPSSRLLASTSSL